MKVRVTIAGTSFGARLTALCWGALTLLAPMAVSACSGSSSTPIPTISPTVTSTVTGSPTASETSTTTPASGTTATTVPGAQTATATATATITVPPSASKIPSAAPVTGGGGTAGLQDGLLFALGAAAILAGAGSIIYRRRLTRNR
jgi:hypothetical protein